jgi:hypothetical protein
MMDNFLNVKCQYINRRGGGYLVELMAQDEHYLWRKQDRPVGPDDNYFRQMQIDSSRPYVERTVSAQAVLAILETLNQAAIPIVPPLTGGFDGVSYRLALRHIESVATYEWWLDCPLSWRPLELAWRAFIALAEE